MSAVVSVYAPNAVNDEVRVAVFKLQMSTPAAGELAAVVQEYMISHV